MLEQAGVSAICIHGRTREQMYAPPIDLNTIADVKKAVSVPVIGKRQDIFRSRRAQDV